MHIGIYVFDIVERFCEIKKLFCMRDAKVSPRRFVSLWFTVSDAELSISSIALVANSMDERELQALYKSLINL